MIKINLADIVFGLEFLSDINAGRFRSFYEIDDSLECQELVSWQDITWDKINFDTLTQDPVSEFQTILVPVCDRLLKYNRCLVHGTAFSWREKGFIFMGPSGTGKTTQYINWKKRYKDEVHILNGDKPVIEQTEDERFLIHPSPWCGKEGWSSMDSMELKGIIYLEQGTVNSARKMEPTEAVLPILGELLCSSDTVEIIERAVSFEESMITHVPVWHMVNRGDVASAELMHGILEEYLKDGDAYA